VTFQSHLDGSSHRFTPASTSMYRWLWAANVMMGWTSARKYPTGHEYARQAMQRTVRWAEAGVCSLPGAAHGAQALFPIVQGSMFTDLRRECAAQLVELDADGYAVAGFGRGTAPLSLRGETEFSPDRRNKWGG